MLYEVRLAGLHTYYVVAASHERALQLALREQSIKATDPVVVAPVANFIDDRYGNFRGAPEHG